MIRERLERRIVSQVGRAIGDFSLIAEGDRLLVALSGGKDSYTLLHALQRLQRRAPVRFAIEAANFDPGWPGYHAHRIRQHAERLGVVLHTVSAPIEQLARANLGPGEPVCPLCARMRRGALYTLCREQGLNKLALGHHLDDAAETLLLNAFYAGALRAMPPLLRRDEPPHVIRPLCYVLERDTAALAVALAFPIVDCPTEHCAGSGRDPRRRVLKGWLAELERSHPRLKHSLRRALGNVDGGSFYRRASPDAGD